VLRIHVGEVPLSTKVQRSEFRDKVIHKRQVIAAPPATALEL